MSRFSSNTHFEPIGLTSSGQETTSQVPFSMIEFNSAEIASFIFFRILSTYGFKVALRDFGTHQWTSFHKACIPFRVSWWSFRSSQIRVVREIFDIISVVSCMRFNLCCGLIICIFILLDLCIFILFNRCILASGYLKIIFHCSRFFRFVRIFCYELPFTQ